jgi:predicted MFS family arabinose efflux permease
MQPIQGWNIPLLGYLADRRKTKTKFDASLDTSFSSASPPRYGRDMHFPNPLNGLKLFAEKDIGILLFYNAFVYTTFITIIASTPYLFGRIYHFNDLQIGLCYLAFGVASFLAPLINGRLLDWNFERVAARAGITLDKQRAQNLVQFPLELARLPIAMPMAIIGAMAMLCYGWVMEVEGPLAAALVLQFIIGLTMTGCFQTMNVIIVDYCKCPPFLQAFYWR